ARHDDDARQGGEQRMLPASLEREGATKELGDRASTARAQAELRVDGILGEQILEPERRAAGIVAQPVRVAARENQEIARAERSWLSVLIDLEPAASCGDDMKGREPTGVHAEAPGRAQRRAAEDGARDAEVAQQGVDRVRVDR